MGELVRLTWPLHAHHVCQRLWHLLREDFSTDFELSIKDNEEDCVDQPSIRVHRLIISAVCPLFKQYIGDKILFSNRQNVDFQEVNSLVEFIYRGKTTVTQESLPKLRDLANSMGLTVLVEIIDGLLGSSAERDTTATATKETQHSSSNSMVIDLDDDTTRDDVESVENHIISENAASNKRRKSTSRTNKDEITRKKWSIRWAKKRKKRFKCQHCPAVCDSPKDLDNHVVAIHHLDSQGNILDKTIKCPKCAFTCYAMFQLNRHRRLKHRDRNPLLKCDKCHFLCRYDAQLSRHLDTSHADDGIFKCSKCDHVSNSRKENDQHVRQHKYSRSRCDLDKMVSNNESILIHTEVINLAKDSSRDDIEAEKDDISEKVPKDSQQTTSRTEKCSKTGNRKRSVRLARRRNEVLGCEHCPRRFNCPQVLARHVMAIHHLDRKGNKLEKTIKCPKCDFTCYASFQLHGHMRLNMHNCARMFKCDKCNHTSHTRKEHEQHVREHDDNGRSLDEMVSNNETPLTNAEVIEMAKVADAVDCISGNVPDQSQQTIPGTKDCSQTGNKKSSAGWERSSKRSFGCEYCPRRFKNKQELFRHLMAVHHLDSQGNKLEKTIKCSECEYTCYAVFQLKKHIAVKKHTHSKNVPADSTCDNAVADADNCISENVPEQLHLTTPGIKKCSTTDSKKLGVRWETRVKGSFRCQHCNRGFKCDKDLFRHVVTIHHLGSQGGKLEKTIKCSKCDFTCHTRFQLKKHMILNKNTRSHMVKCDKCDFVCRTEVLLSGHLETFHTDDGIFICKICDHVSNTRDELDQHVEQHNDNGSSCDLEEIVSNNESSFEHQKDPVLEDDGNSATERARRGFVAALTRSMTAGRNTFTLTNDSTISRGAKDKENVEDEIEEENGEVEIDEDNEVEKGEDNAVIKDADNDKGEKVGKSSSPVKDCEMNEVSEKVDDEDCDKMEVKEQDEEYLPSKLPNSCSVTENLKKFQRFRVNSSVTQMNKVCQHCSFRCCSDNEMVKHVSETHEQNSLGYKCQHCDFSCVTMLLLREHENSKHGESDQLESRTSTVEEPTSNLEPTSEANPVCSESAGEDSSTTIQILKADEKGDSSGYTILAEVKDGKITKTVSSADFNCKHCSYSCDFNYAINRLLSSVQDSDSELNNSEENIKCPRCNYICYTMVRVDNHTSDIHNSEVSVISQSVLSRHQNRCHPPKWICKKCGAVLKSSLALNTHMKIHSGGDEHYRCHLCPKTKQRSYKFKTTLMVHLEQKHQKPCGNLMYLAGDSIRIVVGVEEKHRAGSHSLKCHKCPFVCSSDAQLSHHLETFHSDGIFKCSECDHVSRTRYELHQHMTRLDANGSSCESVSNAKLLLKRKKKKGIMSSQCQHCSLRINRKHLVKHLAAVHHVDRQGNKLGKTIKCSKCDYTCYAMFQLIKHMRAKERTWSHMLKCDKCDFACSSEVQLAHHLETLHVSNSGAELLQHVDQHDDNRSSCHLGETVSSDELSPSHQKVVPSTDILSSTAVNESTAVAEVPEPSVIVLPCNLPFGNMDLVTTMDNTEDGPMNDHNYCSKMLPISCSNSSIETGVDTAVELRVSSAEIVKENPSSFYSVLTLEPLSDCLGIDSAEVADEAAPKDMEDKDVCPDRLQESCSSTEIVTAVKMIEETTTIETDEKTFQCQHCSYNCSIEKYLITHMMLKHEMDLKGNKLEKSFQCTKCEFSCVRPFQLRRHDSIVHREQIKCDQCSHMCHNQAELSRHHQLLHGKDRPFHCDICGYSCKTQISLDKHIVLHKSSNTVSRARRNPSNTSTSARCDSSNTTMFKCPKCGQSFQREKPLTVHLRNVHDIGAYEHSCNRCHRSFRFKGELENHKKNSLCTRNYKIKSVSVRRTCQNAGRVRVRRTYKIGGPFTCDQCGHISKSISAHDQHLKLFGHGRFVCEVCGVVLKYAASFWRHQKDQHTAGSEPQVCDVCQTACDTKWELRLHMNKEHEVEIPNFIRDGSRKKDGPPFNCDKCDYTTPKYKLYRSHEKWHNEPKRTCEVCGAKLKGLRSFKIHMKRHENN